MRRSTRRSVATPRGSELDAVLPARGRKGVRKNGDRRWRAGMAGSDGLAARAAMRSGVGRSGLVIAPDSLSRGTKASLRARLAVH
jgi:hypothetical protein